jgi:hypothetical protein
MSAFTTQNSEPNTHVAAMLVWLLALCSNDAVPMTWVPGSGASDSSDHIRLALGPLSMLQQLPAEHRPRVDLLLAVPRPLQLERMLPMISSLGMYYYHA